MNQNDKIYYNEMDLFKEGYDFPEATRILEEYKDLKGVLSEEVRFSVIRAIGKAPNNPGTSDKVIRLLNGTENYKTDPLYELAGEGLNNREEWPEGSDLFSFYKTIQVKIENRCLSEYNELYNDETKTINNEIIDKYCQIQIKYGKIGFNRLSIGDSTLKYPNSKKSEIYAIYKGEFMTMSNGEKTIIELLNFLEGKYEELKTMNDKGIDLETFKSAFINNIK